jgi:hypothetical protein
MGVGRSGGVMATALGGLVSTFSAAFMMYALAFAIGAVFSCCFQIETSNRALTDAV